MVPVPAIVNEVIRSGSIFMAMAVFLAIRFSLAAAGAPPAGEVQTTTNGEMTGRIEGRIQLSRPTVQVADAALSKSVRWRPDVRLKSISLLVPNAKDPIAEAEIDEHGNFAFDIVPAGPVRLRPNFVVMSPSQLAEYWPMFSLGPAYTLHTAVRAGETTHVGFFGRGRPVTGKVALPAGIKPDDVTVHLVMTAPPFRALRGTGNQPRPTPIAVAYSLVNPEGPLTSRLDADGQFRIEGVREGTYRIQVAVGNKGGQQNLWFHGYAEGDTPWIEHGIFVVPLMKDGASARPLDIGSPQFERPPKAG